MKHDVPTKGLRGAVLGTCRRCGQNGVHPDDACSAQTMDARVARLLRRFRPGEHVRATVTIVYGTGEEVPEGTLGRIQRANVNGCGALVTVAWEGPSVEHPCSVESLDSLGPAS